MTVLYIGQALSNAPSIALIPGPSFRDDFTSAGNLNGRTGWTVETRPAFTAQVNAIAAADGFAGGTTGNAAWALNTAPVVDAWLTVRIGVVASSLYMHANIAAVDAERDWLTWQFLQTVTGGINTGFVGLRKVVNGATAFTILSIAGLRLEVGDVWYCVSATAAGTTTLTPYLNGRQASSEVDISEATTGVALNKKHGFIGNTGATAVDSFQVGDPATEVVMRLFQPNRMVYHNADGSVTWRGSVTYTGPAPSTLYATIYSRNSGADVAIVTDRAVSELVAAAGVATFTVTASAAEIATAGPYSLRIVRKGLLASSRESIAGGPLQYPGYIIGTYGQSLNTESTAQLVTTDTYVAPTNTFWIDGAPTDKTVLGDLIDNRQLPVTSNTTVAALAKAFSDATSGKLCTVIKGGAGGSTIAERAVGTVSHTALLDGIEHAGGRLHLLTWMDGQGDATSATTEAAYTASMQAFADDIASRNGGSIKVMVNPLAAAWSTAGGSDENWQTIRRAQDKLPTVDATRYFRGANALDLQKRDDLHLVDNAYGELMRRQGWNIAKALGLTTYGRGGPKMFSVTKNSATEVYVLYDLDGADSLELVNTGYASEFHGGMVFSDAATITSGTIANKIYPTNAVVDGSPSAGKQGITFTIPSIAGTVYAWACYGKDPFNPTQNVAIRADMAGKASMIRAVRSGEPSVGLRAYFGASVDYITAS